MTIDHLMIKVASWENAKAYYGSVLGPLGFEVVADWGTGGGFGVTGQKTGMIFVKEEATPGRIHFAISAPSEAAVSEYHKLALAAGGKDNGAPGHRAHYPENGVGCFVIDLDDNNVECVYRP